jgi:hypothetical protein
MQFLILPFKSIQKPIVRDHIYSKLSLFRLKDFRFIFLIEKIWVEPEWYIKLVFWWLYKKNFTIKDPKRNLLALLLIIKHIIERWISFLE